MKELKIRQRKQQGQPEHDDIDSFPFLCFDTEDDSKECMAPGSGKTGFDKKVTQIASITAAGKRYYCPGNVKDFKRWLSQQPEQYIYSLNIKYDLGALFGDSLDELDQTLVGGRVIKAVWGKKTFVDVFNIWPMSVAKIGKAFGLEKLETESMATDKEYVFRDVEIIRRAMLFAWQFARDLGLEKLPATLGGLCVAVWQEWDGANCHDSTDLCREALFGGRVELFKTTNETRHICWTDINSLYPSVMRGMFPGPLELWKKKRLPKFGVATVTIRVPKMDLCPLPFRRDDGMILYPWGKFMGTWTIAEIKNAVALGAKIVKRHECYGTDQGLCSYKDFVDRLYLARQRGKSDAENLFYKLLMNNLYGRLGTMGKIGRTVWQTPKNRNQGVPFGERVLVTYQMPLSEETNWSHAAYVTAYGRIELLRHMRLIGAKAMIYCDTDSCIFDCPSRLIPFETGGALGQMKLVAWEKHCATYAPKMYNIGKVWKAKGVPVRLAKEFIQNGAVEYDMPFNMREAIAFFDRGNIKKLAVWRTVRKEKRTAYTRKKLFKSRYFPCKISAV
jgi:hypothetical protein